MNVIECIESRRSVRKYSDKKVSRETIDRLIELGTMAPSAMNKQPWGFVVIQDKEEIDALSEKIKAFLLENIDTKFPSIKRLEGPLQKRDFSIFHHAENLIVIYGNTESDFYTLDCSLAAQNIMLAANSMDIGTCWVGFAQFLFDDEEFKSKYNVLENYKLVSTLTLGYMEERPKKGTRKKAIVFND